jgi:thiol:disulfide interchange protein DsbD
MVMRLRIILFALFIIPFMTRAQNTIRWEFSAKRINDKTFELHLAATLNDPWHIYSQTTPKNGPSFPTKIAFTKNPLVVFDGKVKEVGNLITEYEKVLQVELKYYSDMVDFVQVVRLTSKVKTNVNGTINYMICNDEMCLPPDEVTFSVKLE